VKNLPKIQNEKFEVVAAKAQCNAFFKKIKSTIMKTPLPGGFTTSFFFLIITQGSEPLL